MPVETPSKELACNGGTPIRTRPFPIFAGALFLGDEEIEAVTEVLRGKSPFRYYGPGLLRKVDQLEAAWAKRFDVPHVLAVSSGSQAITIAMSALLLGPGDEVLVPAYGFVTSYSNAIRLGAIPRLVDVDASLSMDPADLARKIGPRTRAIVVIHMSGSAANMDAIMEVARAHDLPVIEDCSQAMGTDYHGRPVGSFGSLSTYSLQFAKAITAGEGGLVGARDKAVGDQLFALHDLGYLRGPHGHSDMSDERFQSWGTGSRMSEITGAVALAQLGKLETIVAAMRGSHRRVSRELAKLPGVTLRHEWDPEGSNGSFIIVYFDSADACAKAVVALRAEGVRGPGPFFDRLEDYGLHWYFNNPSLLARASITRDGFPWTHPSNAFASELSYERGTCPHADDYAARGALLFVSSKLTEEDESDLVKAFTKVCNAMFG